MTKDDGCGGECVERRGVIAGIDEVRFLAVTVETLIPGTVGDPAPGSQQQPDIPPDDAREVMASIYRIGDPRGNLLSAGECERGCYCKLPAGAAPSRESTEARTLEIVFIYTKIVR